MTLYLTQHKSFIWYALDETQSRFYIGRNPIRPDRYTTKTEKIQKIRETAVETIVRFFSIVRQKHIVNPW